LVFQTPRLTRAEHAEAWYGVIKPPSDAVLEKLGLARDKAELIIVDHCPLRAIREVLENGEDVYLGDIGCTRLRDGKLLAPPGVEVDDELAAHCARENAQREPGDPDIVWTIGCRIFNALAHSILIQRSFRLS
jgi:hypothetical protein